MLSFIDRLYFILLLPPSPLLFLGIIDVFCLSLYHPHLGWNVD